MKNKHLPGYKKPKWVYAIDILVVVAGIVIVFAAGKLQYHCMANGYDIGKLAPRTLQPICERHTNGVIEFEYLDTVLLKQKTESLENQ